MKKKTLWRIHSWLGLVTGLPLLVIAFSGSVLVFKDEINALLMPEVVLAEPSAQGRLSLDTLLERARSQLPNHEIVGWAIYEEKTRADYLYVVEHGDHEWLHVHLNPYTGELLEKPGGAASDLMGWLLVLHYSLLADHLGIAITGLLAILLCLLGVTGMLIYRRFWKSFFTFRWRTSWRLLSGNLHKRIGTVSAPVFLILGFTGAVWNLSHIFEEAGEDHENPATRGSLDMGVSLDRLAHLAENEISGFYLTYVNFPPEAGDPVTFYGSIEGQSAFRSPYNSTVSFDSTTGEVIASNPASEAPIGLQVYDSFTPLHFGTFGGLLTRVLWCVLGAAPGILAISGFLVWRLRRKRTYVETFEAERASAS